MANSSGEDRRRQLIKSAIDLFSKRACRHYLISRILEVYRTGPRFERLIPHASLAGIKPAVMYRNQIMAANVCPLKSISFITFLPLFHRADYLEYSNQFAGNTSLIQRVI